MKAYEKCLRATSTSDTPWYVVPGDDTDNARLIVSKIILDTFEGLKMAYPKTSTKRRRELLSIRKQLAPSEIWGASAREDCDQGEGDVCEHSDTDSRLETR